MFKLLMCYGKKKSKRWLMFIFFNLYPITNWEGGGVFSTHPLVYWCKLSQNQNWGSMLFFSQFLWGTRFWEMKSNFLRVETLEWQRTDTLKKHVVQIFLSFCCYSVRRRTEKHGFDKWNEIFEGNLIIGSLHLKRRDAL